MSDERRYDDFLADIDQLNQPQRESDYLDGVAAVSGGAAPGEPLGPLGERVRRIREEKGLTLQDVASRTGFDPSYLSKIESGDHSPPLGVLIKLGKALDMKMGYFISGGETKAYTVVREAERQRVSRRAAADDKAYGYTYQSLAPGKTDRHMEPFIVVLEPSKDEVLSSHDGQEFIYVLEGRMEAVLDKERVILDAGDAIYYDSNLPHMVRCADGPFARILAVLYAYDK